MAAPRRLLWVAQVLLLCSLGPPLHTVGSFQASVFLLLCCSLTTAEMGVPVGQG